MTLIKMTKTQVIAHVRKHGSWKGYLVGCNVAEYHIVGGWSLGYLVELVSVPGGWVGIKDDENSTFDDLIRRWGWYNANSETGNYAAYYMIN